MLQKALILLFFVVFTKSQTTAVTKSPSTSLPQLNLTSNSSQIYLNVPFKLTCSISHFNASGKRYSVNYYDSRDNLLATYKVDATGKSLLSVGMSTDLFAHHGPRSSFPAFDLVITERTDPHQRYWCELEVEEKTSKKLFQSNFWAFTGIFAHFNTTSTVLVKNGAQIERQGRCSIAGFAKHSETEFKVEYHYFLKANGHRALFAYYWLQPNSTPEFVHQLHGAPWQSITPGNLTVYPDFEVITTTSRAGTTDADDHNEWWCELTVGRSGQATYQRIKSNVDRFTKR